MTVRALAVLAVIAALATPAAADDGQDAFNAATALIGAGDLEGARTAFDAIVAADPAGDWADDGLAWAAEMCERLGDLDGAHQRWRRYLDDYPTRPLIRRARLRLAALDRKIGGDAWIAVAEQLAALEREAVDAEDPTPQAEAIAALLAANPEFPAAFDARIRLGNLWMRLALVERAAETFRDAGADATDDDERWRAAKAHADTIAALGDLDAAEREYRALRGRGGAQDDAIDSAIATLDKIRSRARLRLLCWLALAASLVVIGGVLAWATRSPVGALRAVIRPPVEVVFLIPVAIVIAVVAMRGNELVAAAVRMILLGGVVTTWLVGASLEACRRHRRVGLPIVLVHVATATVAIAAVCYLAVFDDQLLDLIAETWQHGHDG